MPLYQIDGLAQERRNSIAKALELHFLALTHPYAVYIMLTLLHRSLTPMLLDSFVSDLYSQHFLLIRPYRDSRKDYTVINNRSSEFQSTLCFRIENQYW